MVKVLGLLSAALFICLLAAAPASADSISVANPSFETLPAGGLPAGCAPPGCFFSEGPIPGWTNSGFSGQFQPGTQDGNFKYFNTLSNGITGAYSNGGTISQTVTTTVQTSVVYTLQVDLGHRNDLPFDATADLLINGIQYLATGTAPLPGDWSTFTATYTGLAADAGDPLTIELNSSGQQGNFDNVVLSDNLTTTPEPSSLLLLCGGLLVVAGVARRKLLA